jgi:hypothetical protein
MKNIGNINGVSIYSDPNVPEDKIVATPTYSNEQLRDVIAKSLKSFGFQYAIRHCQTPKHGDGAYVVENWTAETLATFIVDDVQKAIQQATKAAELRGRLAGMEQAKSRVLRRTEIPKDAKNPTRDVVVEVGEVCAEIIEQDIAELKSQLPEEGKDDN